MLSVNGEFIKWLNESGELIKSTLKSQISSPKHIKLTFSLVKTKNIIHILLNFHQFHLIFFCKKRELNEAKNPILAYF